VRGSLGRLGLAESPPSPGSLCDPTSPRKRGEVSGPAFSQIAKTRYALRMAHPLARIIDQLKREPSRTGSIVITVFGDAIVPRGGSVWLGTLLEFFGAIDIDSGVVRTAMSRLAADGWLERNKVGRNSFYRLVKKGRQTFDAATKHIYDPQPSDWTGRFELLLIGNGEDRDAAREALKNAGYGSPLPGVWVAPSGVPIPEEAATAIRLEVSAEDDSGRRLLSESWPLDRTADAYLKFMKTFEPLRGWIGRRERLSELDAFTARILLIHYYRRVVLRDPLLPTSLLPKDWPGRAARKLCGEIYRGLLPASEKWLDRNGLNENGTLPAAAAELARRFED
jgi:phenylacetic acid degradation operon negative regulatory protein